MNDITLALAILFETSPVSTEMGKNRERNQQKIGNVNRNEKAQLFKEDFPSTFIDFVSNKQQCIIEL